MYINYDYYRIFYYVAKYGSFTQAANMLINNQPNITRSIKKLENTLGCTLFIRSNRGVRLTPEGEKLYAHVRIAVEQIQAGEEELSLSRSLQSGTVSISTSEVALRCLLLPVLSDYRRTYPGVRLKVSNHSTGQAIVTLKNGSADIALVTTPTGNIDSLIVENIKEIHETAVCGSLYADLAERTVSLEELSALPIISLGSQTMTYGLYTDFFGKYELEFSPNIEVATADQILPMVKNNLGIGFIPREFLNSEDTESVTELKLREPMPTRRICLIKRSGYALNIAAGELEKMILQ